MEHANPLVWAASQIPPLGIVLATLAGTIPTIAALVAIFWYGILIWESNTVKRWRLARAHKKLAKIEAERTMLLSLLKVTMDTPEDKSGP